jgi:hypothetical protein
MLEESANVVLIVLLVTTKVFVSSWMQQQAATEVTSTVETYGGIERERLLHSCFR